MASEVCSVLTGEPSNSLLATLEKDSLLNEISSDQFTHQINDYRILTFYETRMMSVKVGKRKLFPQFTSMVGNPTGLFKGAGLNRRSTSSTAMQLNSDLSPSLSIAITQRSVNFLARKIARGNGWA